MFSKNKYII